MVEGYRLSPQQKRLWLLQRSSVYQAYRVECELSIEGDLCVELLTAALKAVLGRHEILRTTFEPSGDPATPSQVIGDVVTPSIDYHDLSNHEPLEQQSAVETLFGRVGQMGFDVSTGPVLRITLLKLSTRMHLLLLSLPSLCSDAQSLAIITAEIGRTYEILMRNEELDDAAMQYADAAEVLNQLLESEETDLGRAYWHRQDFSVLASLKLPFESIDLADSVFATSHIAIRIPPHKLCGIGQLISSYETTTEVFLLACWQVLFWRMTGQNEVITGTLFDGRTSEEFTEALGTFARYLPVRTHLEAELRFSDVVRQTARGVSESMKWQEYFSWDRLKGLTPDGPEALFFPVCFDFEQGAHNFSFAGLSFRVRSRHSCIDRFKLRLTCFQKDDSLICEFDYDPSCLSAVDARRLADYYVALLDGILENGKSAIGELGILPDDERHQVLAEFSGRERSAPVTALFHEEFERHAGRAADRIAVSFEQHHLSYAGLNERANRLAHYLGSLGVGAETLVALCANASPEVVIGLLGVLKAGAAYLPLDPTLPADRLAFMVNNAGVSVLLTCIDGLSERINHKGRAVHLKNDWDTVATWREDNPNVRAEADSLAYVIYTSGSTGRPKGVLVQGRGLGNLPMAQIAAFDVQPESRVLQFASFGFDASISEVAMALARSATLCLASRETMLPGPSLIRLLKEQAITTVTFPPTVLAVLSDEDLPALGTIIAAGEACPTDVVNRWAPGRRFCNAYGPTEATVCATIAECLNAQEMPSIGRPMMNVQVYILDARGEPVPAGIAGELFIGGIGLARGYLRQPELTAEKWVPNPFGDSGSRLYKSGDWARWSGDGNIEFLGRIDHQVKIRGFRVELGEIENVLGEHPDLKTAVVLTHGDDPEGMRLVAYVVPKQNSGSVVSTLRQFLQQRLPAHLIPAFFVEVDDIPLTRSGKVDRQALAKKNGMVARAESAYVVPSRHTERVIATIWQEILGVQKVGIHDNFFDLGGHSLLMIRIHGMLERQLERELAMIDLFEHPTISALAQHLSRDDVEDPSSESEDRVEKRRKGKNRLQQRFKKRREIEQPIGGQL
jgi:amino acid adenylation domain-containing protein